MNSLIQLITLHVRPDMRLWLNLTILHHIHWDPHSSPDYSHSTHTDAAYPVPFFLHDTYLALGTYHLPDHRTWRCNNTAPSLCHTPARYSKSRCQNPLRPVSSYSRIHHIHKPQLLFRHHQSDWMCFLEYPCCTETRLHCFRCLWLLRLHCFPGPAG